MNLISRYSKLSQEKNSQWASGQQSHFYNQQQYNKVISALLKLKFLNVVILSPQVNRRYEAINVNNIISFCLLHDSKVRPYEYCVNFETNNSSFGFKIQVTILKDGQIFNVYKQGLVQSLCAFLLKINFSLRHYSLRIHPFTGAIKLVFTQVYNPINFDAILSYPANFVQDISKIIAQMIKQLEEKIMSKILILSNQLPLTNIVPQSFDKSNFEPMINNFKQFQSLHPFLNQQVYCQLYQMNKKLKQIKKYMANSTIKYHCFTKNSKLKFYEGTIKKREPEKQYNAVFHNVKILPFSSDVKRILKLYTPISRLAQQQCYSYSPSSWLEPSPKQMQTIQQFLKCQNLKRCGKVVTPITIQQIQSQAPLCSGGFASITRIVAKVVRQNEIENPQAGGQNNSAPTFIKQTLIRKSAEMERLYWQKDVIKQIENGSCLFINKYYQVSYSPNFSNANRVPLQDSIFMQYCQQKSLNHFFGKLGPITSVKTKLFLLYQTTIGLRFLRDYGVVHLDVKPENILLRMALDGNRNPVMIVKIIDFGQAFYQTQLGNKKNNRGFTCPYAPPELIFNKHSHIKFTQKSDVFSLGVMILTLIFELNATDIKRLTSNYVFETNQRYLKFYSLCIQRCRYIGFEPVMQCLIYLAFKCIHPNCLSRPYLNWVCVILRAALHILDQIQKL